MRAAGLTDVGMLRHENQDAFGVFPTEDKGALLAVVCDGMGGACGGKEAAETCLATLKDTLLGGDVPTDFMLSDALSRANGMIRARTKEQGYDCMGTTVVLALADGEAVTLFWVGDSRAYLWRDGTLSRLTRDHSYVQSLIDEGRITEEEAKNHVHRNLITRAIGSRDTVLADSRRIPWQRGDRILLCSDGLYSMVEEKEICEILSEGDAPAHMAHVLVAAANSHGGEDNITALILENTKENSSDA